MRDAREVVDKFHQLKDRYLRERKEKFLGRSPSNCFFNFKQHVRANGKVGFCQNPDVIEKIGTKVFVCNDDETAQRCQSFSCRNTSASVEHDFVEIMHSPAKCGQEYPKLAMMIWFLQDIGTHKEHHGLLSGLRRLKQRLFGANSDSEVSE
jgi:hypothetical protein